MKTQNRARDAIVTAPVVIVLFAGYVKASPALESIPVDLTMLGMVLLVLAASSELVRTRQFPSGLLLFILSTIAFLVLTLKLPDSGYASRKVELLFLLTLPAGLASAIVVSSMDRVWWLARWSVIGALVIGVLLRLAPGSADLDGRYALAATSTLAIGRGCGAGLVALIMLLMAGKLRVLVAAPIGIVLLFLIFGSGSRGPLIAVGVAAIVASLTRIGARRARDIALLLASGAAAGAWTLSKTNSAAADRFMLLFNSGDQGDSVDARRAMYRRASDEVLRHPFGDGWGGLEGVLAPIAHHPHNVFLEVFGEAGWIPGLIFVCMVIIAFIRSFKFARATGCVAAIGLLMFWTINAFVSGDVNDNRGLFVMLAIALTTPSFMEPAAPPSPEARPKRIDPFSANGAWT